MMPAFPYIHEQRGIPDFINSSGARVVHCRQHVCYVGIVMHCTVPDSSACLLVWEAECTHANLVFIPCNFFDLKIFFCLVAR